MFVLGTAGHIDHGKSTLIRALTGIDPDRLAEEKARGMTIDLGFAWFTLPSGREIGVVDVPGHARFLKNMLAGVGGVDFVLFVVAANEGWMPQSQEHLSILSLLGTEHGVVALTKVDLVDEEWIELVREEIAERFRQAGLPVFPIVPVSATTGEGLPELVDALDRAADQLPPPPDRGRPKLWIDRVFTVRGVGTVVTGTLHGGSLASDDEVEILPQGLRARVRGIETHLRPVREARPVSRVACNLPQVPEERLARGSLLARPGLVPTGQRADTWLRILPEAEGLATGMRVKAYLGSAERNARVRVLGDEEEIGAGAHGFVQLEFDLPTPLEAGDRVILRDPSRQATVGGGVVVNPVAAPVRGRGARYVGPAGRSPVRRLFLGEQADRLSPASLRLRLAGVREDPPALLLGLLSEEPFVSHDELPRLVPWSEAEREAHIAKLVQEGRIVSTGSYLMATGAWKRLWEEARRLLAAYHEQHPLATGLPRETLRSRMGVPARLFDEAVAILNREGRLRAAGGALRLPEFEVRFGPEEEAQAARVRALLGANPLSPPTERELVEEHGISLALLRALVGRGGLVRVGSNLYVRQEDMERLKARVREHIEAHGFIDVATLRDLLGTSRKYALPLLEYLDQIEFTRRVGDKRILRQAQE